MAKIKKIVDDGPDIGQLRQWTSELVGVKKTIKDLGTRQTTITRRIKTVLQDDGYTDDQGHLWIDFEEPVDGVVALQMQRKVSKSLNEDKAEAILRKAGIYDDCVQHIEVLDQEAIMAALYAGKLTEADVDAMFPVTESFALLTPTSR